MIISNLREYNIEDRQAMFNKEAFRHDLTQKSRKKKIAKLLGTVTPFCSCSSIYSIPYQSTLESALTGHTAKHLTVLQPRSGVLLFIDPCRRGMRFLPAHGHSSLHRRIGNRRQSYGLQSHGNRLLLADRHITHSLVRIYP